MVTPAPALGRPFRFRLRKKLFAKVSFGDDGSILKSPTRSAEANTSLEPTVSCLSRLTDAHRENLIRHRRKHGFTR